MFSKRNLIFQFLLPVLFIGPEIINLGVMFLRWDYLLIVFFVFSSFKNGNSISHSNQLEWGNRSTLLVLIFISCTLLMCLKLFENEDLIGSLKYAAWPIKSIFWGVSVLFILKKLKGSAETIYRMFTSIAVIVIFMQLFEFFLPSFREFIFTYYPVAAEERLRGLDFRARGPFNGYDLTSLFYTVICVYFIEYSKHYKINKSDLIWRILITIIGSYLSARTGFLLIVFYLLYSYFINNKILGKFSVIVFIIILVTLFPNFISIDSAKDSNLIGRNLEVIQALISGDIFMIQSFSGTFAMNAMLLKEGFDPIWGNGLTADTTADQLYFKYYYMFGQVGLIIWVLIHFSIYYFSRSGLKFTTDQIVYKNSAIIVIVLIAIGHIKGGNYFFSLRLGDIIALLLLLSTLSFKNKFTIN